MAYNQSISSVQHTHTAETSLTAESVSNQPSLTLHQADITPSLNNGELAITISELLGCDYVFIVHPANSLLMCEHHITQTLNQVISTLVLIPGQKIFISVAESEQNGMHFSRLQCEWQGATATQVIATVIAESEQIDFMRMIFDCSSPYEQDRC